MADRSNLFVGRIVDGKFVLDDRDGFAALKNKLEGNDIVLQLRERFNPEDIGHLRRYFHGVVLPRIAVAAGYSTSKEDLAHVKGGLKGRFLTVPMAPGEPVIIKSTESLTRKEYSEFIFSCRQFAAETLHIDIEDPI